MPGLVDATRPDASSSKTKRPKKRKRDAQNANDDIASTGTPKRTRSPPSAAQYKLPAKLRNGYESPVVQQTASLYLPLSPICQRYPIKGLCAEHLSPLVLTYYPPLDGIVLSYANVRVSETAPADGSASAAQETALSRTIDEYAVSYVWVTAEFVLLRLWRGMLLDGAVNLQNESHLGVVIWNLFNASIDRTRIPEDWEWKEGGDEVGNESHDLQGQGHFVDRVNEKVGGEISFRLRDWRVVNASETEKGQLVLDGTLLEPKEDREADVKQQQEAQKKKKV